MRATEASHITTGHCGSAEARPGFKATRRQPDAAWQAASTALVSHSSANP